MPSMRNTKGDAPTFPPGMPVIRSRKVEAGAEERRTGIEVRRADIKRREDDSSSALHASHEKIRRRQARNRQQRRRKSDESK